MSDNLRKGLGDQAQEKMTPDSQKSTLDQGTEKLTSLGDKAAGSLQPGDSKSTTQQLGDTGRSGFDQTQDTAKNLGNQASDMTSNAQKKLSENMPSSGGDAEGAAKSYANQAVCQSQLTQLYHTPANELLQSDMAADAQKKVSENLPSGGQAQGTGKTYIDQASEMASNAAKVVSDTLSDAANKISESSNTGSK
ncbi:MAG: hypothetical protein Q9209_001588 [Squamulea sp. 1 TL-2023]